MVRRVLVIQKLSRRFRKTTLMTIGFGSFLVGIALANVGVYLSLAVVVALAMCALPLLRRRGVFCALACVVIGLSMGLWRGAMFMQKTAPYEALYDKKVVLRVAAEEDAVYGKNSQLTFSSTDVIAEQPAYGALPGRVKISGFGENMVYKGDVLKVTGKLRSTLGGRQGTISYAQLELIAHGNSTVGELRRRFTTGMLNALPEPMASFGSGLLIGQRSTLPQDVTTALAAVGLTHLVAVSGYNLTIIVNAVRRLTKWGSKYQSLMLSLGLIVAFLLVTGLSPSIVRAALVSGLTLWAWYYGRSWKPWLLITFVAALTAAWNPLYVWGDIGWYLSFLAFFGVLVLAPAVTRRLYGTREPRFLHAILIETVCAQLMTFPLILFVFQQVSFISIVSNLLVVPLVPVAMLLSLIAGIAGMVIPMLSGWFAWPARLLLTYMLDVAKLLAKLPHAVGSYSLPVGGLVWMYIVELCGVVVVWRKTRPKYVIITDNETDM